MPCLRANSLCQRPHCTLSPTTPTQMCGFQTRLAGKLQLSVLCATFQVGPTNPLIMRGRELIKKCSDMSNVNVVGGAGGATRT
eukprot:4431856-Amphidinium_carterae.1